MKKRRIEPSPITGKPKVLTCPLLQVRVNAGANPSECIDCQFFAGFDKDGDSHLVGVRCEKER
jgi:hypothetical protein